MEDPKAEKPAGPTPGYTPRLVVKFRDDVDVPAEEGFEKRLDEWGIGPWRRLEQLFPGIEPRRLFTAVTPDRLQELVAESIQRDGTYRPPNFANFFVVDCPAEVEPEAVAKRLRDWRTVQVAYFDPPGSEPTVNPDDPLFPNQGHLGPADDGIDAVYAWPFAGGDGAGQQFIDLERGWTLNHEDLAAHGATLLHGRVVDTARAHGTAVLGVVCAADNAIGCVGVAPHVGSVRVVSYDGSTRANAILAAIDVLPFGGVLLLEAQLDSVIIGGTPWVNLPIEALDAEFEAIRLATALGVTVVEAGGNGGTDLDHFQDAGGNRTLNRSDAAFRDSGAILVGAATSHTPHGRKPQSNFGGRIDCYAWGDSVATTYSDAAGATEWYHTFGNTSAASAVIAGAALVVQGIADARLGFRLSAWQMRAVLANPATGTKSATPAVDRIGVMPNLKAILNADPISVAPDVYLRDFVGDAGAPHAGATAASPDLILRPTAVTGPQAAFGEGSGTENSNTLGAQAEAGQDNFLYVRVRNRGGTDAAAVTATVYWAPSATLLTSDLWTLVGSAILPVVPAGNVLTVSDAITWPAAAVPGPGHYCFVGLVGTAPDPAPAPAAFLVWDNYLRFVRDNNNVAWRNFHVVDNEPAVAADPSGYVALSFLAPGAPDQGRRMRLEVVARLPQGARGLIELPTGLYAAADDRRPATFDKDRRTARVPINPHGVLALGDMLFAAKSRAKLRLLISIPKEARDKPYEVYVRQLFGDVEVGRVTWRLERRRKK